MILDRPDVAKLMLRVSLGGMMLLHGIKKLGTGVGGIEKLFDSKGIPEFVAYGVYLGEVVAPVLMIVGWMTRPAALVVALTMVVAVLTAHFDDITRLNRGGGWQIEVQMLYLLGCVSVALLGGGKYGVARGRGRWH